MAAKTKPVAVKAKNPLADNLLKAQRLLAMIGAGLYRGPLVVEASQSAAAETALPAALRKQIAVMTDAPSGAVNLPLDDLRVCLFALTQAMDSARLLQSHVLSLCGGDLSAVPYQRASEAEQHITAVRRKLITEIEARERLERGDEDAF